MSDLNKTQWDTISAELRAPFNPQDVDFRPQGDSQKGTKKVQAVCYVEARAIMDRLDDTVGAGNWAFDYTPLVLEKGEVQIAKGTLTVFGVPKSDVGEASSFAPSKGCISDTLKRCAVLWGIGRYLYDVVSPWVQTDEWGKLKPETVRELRSKLPRPNVATRPAPTEALQDDEVPPQQDNVTPIRPAATPARALGQVPQPRPKQPQAVADLAAQTVPGDQQIEFARELWAALGCKKEGTEQGYASMAVWLAKQVRAAEGPSGTITGGELAKGTSNMTMAELTVALEALKREKERRQHNATTAAQQSGTGTTGRPAPVVEF